MRTYLTSLLASLALVSCGGGNDVASSGASAVSAATSATTPDVIPNTTATTPTVSTPTKPKINGQIDERTGVASVVAQATVWTPYSNGGCTNSITFASGCINGQTSCGKGPALNQAQEIACMNAVQSANQSQCNALGDEVLWTGGSCQNTSCAAVGQGCNGPPPPPPAAAPCFVSSTYGGTGPLLTANTAPTLAQCAALLPGYATGNPWTAYLNGGCVNSSSWNNGNSGPAIGAAQSTACYAAIANACSYAQCTALGAYWNFQGQGYCMDGAIGASPSNPLPTPC